MNPDPSNIESAIELAKFAFYVGSVGVGLLLSFRTKGYIDLQKTMAVLGDVIARVKQLKEDGHIENLAEAVEEAIELVKKIRKKSKLPAIIEHKIREHVEMVLGPVFGQKPKRLPKKK